MALFDNQDGCPIGSVMTNTGFGNICSQAEVGGNIRSFKNPQNTSQVLDSVGGLLSGLGSAVGDITCAFKGNCAGTTVIHQAPPVAASKGNGTLILLSALIGIPLVAFLGFFLIKIFKK